MTLETPPITTIHGNCYEGMTKEEAQKQGCYKKSLFYMAFEEIDIGYKDYDGNIVGKNDGILQREEILKARQTEYTTRKKWSDRVALAADGALISCLALSELGPGAWIGAGVSAITAIGGYMAGSYYDGLNEETKRMNNGLDIEY